MIDYSDLDKFYIGVEMPVIMNCGGILLELGEDISSLFYKPSDNYYADVNHKGRVVQVLRTGAIITSNYVLDEDRLIQVKSKQEINDNCKFVKRLTFKATDYNYIKSK